MSTYLSLEEQVNIQVTAKNSNYNYKKGANKYMELVYQVFYIGLNFCTYLPENYFYLKNTYISKSFRDMRLLLILLELG